MTQNYLTYVISLPPSSLPMLRHVVQNALREKSKKQQQKQPHWLDYSVAKFGQQLVDDIKSVLKVLVLFLPLPLYWALFDQQGSRWTFQATRMTGDLGFYTIKPDQMQVVNPTLILMFIPIFDWIVYPLLERVGIKRPLQKLSIGGFLAALAFIVSGILETQLEKTYAQLPEPTESQMRIFNGFSCDFGVKTTDIIDIGGFETKLLGPLGMYPDLKPSEFKKKGGVKLDRESVMKSFTFKSNNCARDITKNLTLHAGKADTFFLLNDKTDPTKVEIQYHMQNIEKTKSGDAKVLLLLNLKSKTVLKLIDGSGKTAKTINETVQNIQEHEIVPEKYSIFSDDVKLGDVELKEGGVYTLIVSEKSEGDIQIKLHLTTVPNSIHMVRIQYMKFAYSW